MRNARRVAFCLSVFLAGSGVVGAQSWIKLENQPPFAASNQLLLTDGTVIAHDGCAADWWRLTPDSTGSYVNGTWTQIASLPSGYEPLYFASAVLPDGRVIVEGGEYNSCVPVWSNLGAIYDPLADSWTPVDPPAGWRTIGDAQSVVLPNGTFMLANCCTKETALFDEGSLSWTATGAGKFTVNDEEGWTLLPGLSGHVLTVDAYVFEYDADGTNSEIYDPATGTWSSAGSTIVQLWDSYPDANHASYELGPGVLRPDGTVFWTGANGAPHSPGHTAIYDTHSGSWIPGPDFPQHYDVADGPAALLTNGNVLVQASPGIFKRHSVFFEWNGTTLVDVPSPPPANSEPSYLGNMLVLPTGEILWTDISGNAWVYRSSGAPLPSWAPTIDAATTTITRGSTYLISGHNLNGLSQGAAYGDDAQAATNYPLVRITNDATGHVFYARTHDHSTMAVAYSGAASTFYDVPASMETGAASLVVVTNGIPSAPVAVTVQ